MSETVVGEDGTAPRGVEIGARLRAARDATGLTLADVAQRTRVPLRHLEAIERADYEALPSPTYAVGFARAYARAVGLDEVAAAGEVRAALARVPRSPDYEPYEIPDPARLPSRGLAILAAGAALALLILAGLWFGTDLFRSRDGAAPQPAATEAVVPAAAPSAAPIPAAPTGGQVTVTATGRVWLRVYEAGGRTLFENTLNPGDHYDVPASAQDPLLAIGRPDKVSVTLNGSAVPPLGDGSHAIKDVKVSGAAIAARLGGAPAAVSSPTPTPSPSASSAASASRATSTRSHRDGRPRASASPALSDTQRANLEATPPPAATGNSTP